MRKDLLRKDPGTVLEVSTIILYPNIPQRDLGPFLRVTVHWGKGNNQTFQELLDISSELTLILRDRKHHRGPPGRGGAYGSQLTNEDLVQV